MANSCKKPLETDRVLFVVSAGSYIGEHLLLMEEDADNMIFLCMPDLFIRKIPRHLFEHGVEKGFVEKLDTIPLDIMHVCIAQYEAIKAKNKNSS